MGSPKPLLPWRETTLLGYALGELRSVPVEQIVVVLGLAHAEIRLAVPALGAATVVLNLDEQSERSGSIRIGSAAISPAATAVVVQSVDQPCAMEILRALLTAEGAIAIPTFEGRRGHPLVVSGRLLPELREVDEATQGLRAVVRRHAAEIVEVPVADASVTWNLNDPETYTAARAVYRSI